MKDKNTVADVISWLETMDESLAEGSLSTEPTETLEDDIPLVHDLALTIVSNELLKYIRHKRLPTESEAHALVAVYSITKGSSG